MSKEYQTVDELLELQDKSAIKEKKEKKEKKGKKRLTKKALALIMAGVFTLSTGTAGIVHHFKRKNTSGTEKPNDIIATQIDDMGSELEFTTPDSTKKYGKTTGNVDVNKIEEKDGKVYADKESANKSDNVGKSEIDTKGGTLKVREDGNVYENTVGYEIKDANGTVVQKGELKGNNDIPEGHYKDSKTGRIIPNGHVILENDFYNEQGGLEYSKGDIISNESLELAKKYYFTTKPTTTTQPAEETKSQPTPTKVEETQAPTTEKSDEGVINEDGTYTIYGVTYLTKADFEQCILTDFEGYGIVDGIVRPVDLSKVSQKSK